MKIVTAHYLPPTKEEVHVLPVFVCLSVCLLARLLTILTNFVKIVSNLAESSVTLCYRGA